MKPTSRMWLSAGLVGVILAGGASIAVAASAGRLDRAGLERTPVGREGEILREDSPFPLSSGRPAPVTDGGTRPEDSGSTGTPDGVTVYSHELTADPESVLEYWTEERMRDAEPQRMPVIVVDPTN